MPSLLDSTQNEVWDQIQRDVGSGLREQISLPSYEAASEVVVTLVADLRIDDSDRLQGAVFLLDRDGNPYVELRFEDAGSIFLTPGLELRTGDVAEEQLDRLASEYAAARSDNTPAVSWTAHARAALVAKAAVASHVLGSLVRAPRTLLGLLPRVTPATLCQIAAIAAVATVGLILAQGIGALLPGLLAISIGAIAITGADILGWAEDLFFAPRVKQFVLDRWEP